MRDVVTLALIALLFGCLVSFIIIQNAPTSAQLHNPYWPYSVETVIKDR